MLDSSIGQGKYRQLDFDGGRGNAFEPPRLMVYGLKAVASNRLPMCSVGVMREKTYTTRG